jgi:hypothetical protein
MAGTWKSVVPSVLGLLALDAISRIDSTMRISDTLIMINENTIFPTVDILAFPYHNQPLSHGHNSKHRL